MEIQLKHSRNTNGNTGKNGMSKYVKFCNLEVWKLGLEIVKKVYKISKDFPADEKYGLVIQIKRAAVSICANIAEGYGRYHYMDRTKFYLNARGSLFELESHLIISNQLGFLNNNDFNEIKGLSKNLSIKLNNLISKERRQEERKNAR